jgi:hypothetical protein
MQKKKSENTGSDKTNITNEEKMNFICVNCLQTYNDYVIYNNRKTKKHLQNIQHHKEEIVCTDGHYTQQELITAFREKRQAIRN